MWTNPTVNSIARRSGKNWYVDAYGGFARYGILTPDAEMMVLCHEMGHHLGNFPKSTSIYADAWAALEGQADYFATMKCFRRIAGSDDNTALMSSVMIPAEVNTG
jgi:hypothetical protein